MAVYAGTMLDSEFAVKFDRTWNSDNITVSPFLRVPTCRNNPDVTYRYEADEYREWLNCTQKDVKEWDAINGRLYEPVINEVGQVEVWVLLAIFSALTSLSHFVLWYSHDGFYSKLLQQRQQPVRWLEYTVTSPIMMLVTAGLSKVTDFYVLLLLVVANMFMNLCGGLVFEVLDHYDGGWPFVGEWHQQREWKQGEWQVVHVLAATKWLLYFMSWIVFGLSFALIFDAFYSGIQPFYEFESGYLWEELFGFIKIINWTLFGCYFTFPLIHVLQIFRYVEYHKAELFYIAASFLAKGALVAIYLFAATQRKD